MREVHTLERKEKKKMKGNQEESPCTLGKEGKHIVFYIVLNATVL